MPTKVCYHYAMPTTTLRELGIDETRSHLARGAAFVDLRPVDDYLEVHLRGSLPLVYEFGPGMANRARDCLPLDLPLVLLGTHDVDLDHAAASLRGKGFAVPGLLRGGIEEWSRHEGTLISTEILDEVPALATVLDVGDPGAGKVHAATRIPGESLWSRVGELHVSQPVVVVAGKGIRAGLAVGILEFHRFVDVTLYRPGRS